MTSKRNRDRLASLGDLVCSTCRGNGANAAYPGRCCAPCRGFGQISVLRRALRWRLHAAWTAEADHAAANANGWTATRSRWGTVTVRDPRFDLLAAGLPVSESAAPVHENPAPVGEPTPSSERGQGMAA